MFFYFCTLKAWTSHKQLKCCLLVEFPMQKALPAPQQEFSAAAYIVCKEPRTCFNFERYLAIALFYLEFKLHYFSLRLFALDLKTYEIQVVIRHQGEDGGS